MSRSSWGRKDKSPETVKGEWFYDWDDQSLAKLNV